MEFEVRMPDLATTGSAMTLLRWLAHPGDRVQRGQKLLEVETDKAATEVECTVTGVLRETRSNPGDSVCGGDLVAIIETAETHAGAPAPAATVGPAGPAVSPPPPTAKRTGGLFARNREAAAQRVATAAVETKPGEGVPLSLARRTAGRRLQQSKQTIPHFYLQTSANAQAMVARRQAALPEKLVWEAFFVQAVSRVLPNFGQLACRLEDDVLLPAHTNAIGVAVDIDGDLLIVPVAAPAQKTFGEISGELRGAIATLRQQESGDRKSRPGCFTITNLGGANVETFTAIINPPEAAILAVGKIRPVVVPRNETELAIETRVNLTLSVDHRVVNGKYAADFLGAVVAEIEQV
jgi:pyruvate dehydrogenase E2 component (dihydrolipoamide acetyltransferase)